MNLIKITTTIIALITCLFVFSCSNKISYHYPQGSDIDRKSRGGNFSSKSFNFFDSKKNNKVDNFSILWSSAAEVVSQIIPISVIDEKSGIIASEWYQENEDSLKRIKINILIKRSQNVNEAIRVSVFQQKRSSKGDQWQGNVLHNSNSVADSAMKAEEIKKQIIKNAKLKQKQDEEADR